MLNIKIQQVLYFLFIFNFAKSINCGYAFLKTIRNYTEFPVSISYTKNIHDQLQKTETIRLKSLKKTFLQGGAYYAPSEIQGTKYLKASKANNAPQNEFKLHRYIEPSLKDWLGFSIKSDPTKFLMTNSDKKVWFDEQTNFENKFGKSVHWKIDGKKVDNIKLNGKKLTNIKLKSQLSNEYLTCLDLTDNEYTPPPTAFMTYIHKTNPKGGWGGIRSQSFKIVKKELKKEVTPKLHDHSYDYIEDDDPSKLNYDDLELFSKHLYKPLKLRQTRWLVAAGSLGGSAGDGAAKDKWKTFTLHKTNTPYPLDELICFINKTRYHIPQKGNLKIALKTIDRFAEHAEKARLEKEKAGTHVLFGDHIKLIHLKTWQQLYSSENNDVFCSNENSPDEAGEPNNCWWRIENADNPEDTSSIENNSVVKFKHVKTGKFLTGSQSNPTSPKIIWGKTSKNSTFWETDGIDYLTNITEAGNNRWIIEVKNNTRQTTLYKCSEFYLINEDLKIKLRSSSILTELNPNKQRVTASEVPESSNDECIWFINDNIHKALPFDNIAWSGVPFDLDINTSTTLKDSVEIEIVTQLPEVENIIPGTSSRFELPLKNKNPKISGIGKRIINIRNNDYRLNLTYNENAIAWLSTQNTIGTLKFNANAQNESEIYIYFGTKITNEFSWKISLNRSNISITERLQESAIPATPLENDLPIVNLTYIITSENNDLIIKYSKDNTNFTEAIRFANLATSIFNPSGQPCKIGFGSNGNNAQISNIEVENQSYSENLTLIYPYHYELSQDSKNPIIKDTIKNAVYKLNPTPNNTKKYFFSIEINSEGEPNIFWQDTPSVPPQKIHLDNQAFVTYPTQ